MKKHYLIMWILAMITAGLFCYNYWSYSSGRCSMESLWAISFPAAILLGINIAALVSLYVVKQRRHKLTTSLQCDCGAPFHVDWQFCPTCGQGRNQHMPTV